MDEQARNQEITEFVLDHYSLASSWTPEEVDNWTAWAANEGFLFLCYDLDEKLVGLCIARPISLTRNLSEIKDTDFDKDGEVIYVDVTISTKGKVVMQAMMIALLKKMGDKPFIAFKRVKTPNKYNVYRLGDFANKLLRGKA